MIDFPRYLAVKKTVDDRALNRFVWAQLRAALSTRRLDRPLHVLELGCGIGTMVERLLAWDLAAKVDYLGIDSQVDNIQAAQERLYAWGQENGYRVGHSADRITLENSEQSWLVRFQQADATRYQHQPGFFDLLIANAFLDLVDVPGILPNLASLLASEGLFYFTINFDCETIFEPVSEPDRETRLMALYHQNMDQRRVDGRPSGDSCTGRHLFSHLKAAGAKIFAAGASDWVVYPGLAGYPSDEAYFLYCILDFFQEALKNHPALAPGELQAWLSERRGQIERAELVYIAHQLDFLGSFGEYIVKYVF
jgi:SAM-dependent methyltransferase